MEPGRWDTESASIRKNEIAGGPFEGAQDALAFEEGFLTAEP
jgi:hypothetical protein